MGTAKQAIGGVAVGGAEVLFPAAIRQGELLFLSGQAAIDPATRSICAPDFAAQGAFVLDQIAATLSEAGSSLDQVLRVECILADPGDFAAWNELFASTFTPPRPARTTIVAGFALPGLLIEVQVTAHVD